MSGVRTTRRTPVFDAVRAQLRALRGRWRFTIQLRDPLSLEKIGWLKDGDRDFFANSPGFNVAVMRAFRAALEAQLAAGSTPHLDPEAAGLIAAGVARDYWVARLEGTICDVPLAPLSPRYAAWKAYEGLHFGIGRATDALLEDLIDATFTAQKIG